MSHRRGRDRQFDSNSLQQRAERTVTRVPAADRAAESCRCRRDRVGHWIDERIDLRSYTQIWKTAAPAHLIDVAVFCASDDPHTGTAAELVGQRTYLCPALIYRPNHSAVQPFRLIGTRAGLRPEIPELVFDTTFLSWRPADAWLFRWQAGVGANPCRLLRRPAGPACRRGRSALRCRLC